MKKFYVWRRTQNSARFRTGKYLEWARSTGIKLHGWKVLWYMNMLSSYRHQKFFFFFGFRVRQICRISTICEILDGQNWVVYSLCSLSWAGQDWWRSSRVRVEDFPRAHYAKASQWSPKHDGERTRCSAERFQGSHHIHVYVQGQPKNMKKFVNAIPQGLPKMPKVFPKDIGHSSDLDLKKMVRHVRL